RGRGAPCEAPAMPRGHRAAVKAAWLRRDANATDGAGEASGVERHVVAQCLESRKRIRVRPSHAIEPRRFRDDRPVARVALPLAARAAARGFEVSAIEIVRRQVDGWWARGLEDEEASSRPAD